MKNVARKLVAILFLSALAALLVRFYMKNVEFYYAGTLESTKVDISAQVPSTISVVHFQEGDRVKSGDTLVTLACEDIKIAATFAKQNYNRYTKLSQSGSTTSEMLDTMRNRKEDMELKLSWCKIRSPITGSLMSRYHEPGEWVGPGVRLLTVSDAKDVWAYVYVPQPLLGRVSLGLKVKAHLPELKGRSFEGQIVKINEEAEFTPKNVQTREERSRLIYGIKISFKDANSDGVLKPGMTLEVELPE